MSETLISRVLRIVSGNVHDAIDVVENREAEVVMREALREIDRTISDVKTEISRANGTRLLSAKRLEMTDAKLHELTDKARLAIGENRDDLAEAAVTRQLDLETQIPILEKSRDAAAKKCDELAGYLQSLAGRKSEMEGELDAYVETGSDNVTSLKVAGGTDITRHEDRANQAIDAFDRAMKSGNGSAGYTGSNGHTVVKLSELNSLIRRNLINDRLAVLKSENDESS